ncbi:hypothetical protein BD413DRAFT_632767 [Trametes elegans]|nr:hypothetical protein BD413DRAFT_632767 [Trametes elegans]
MAAVPLALQDELAELVDSLDGLERTRYLSIASTCVLLYDMLLTFDEEFEYFWKSGPWTTSRVLYFLNRYFPPVCLASAIIGILGLLAPNLSITVTLYSCTGLVHANFILSVVGLAVVQAIIVLRICYVYSKDFIVRGSVVACFVATTVVTVVIYGKIWHDVDPVAIPVPGLVINGCTAPTSREIWKLFVPNLVLHTVLYLATTIPALRMRRVGKDSRLLNRLVRDGGIFYFNIFVRASHPAILRNARSHTLLLTIAAISVSRLMLSIRSLAARLSVSPDWLLNNTELSRVNWKPGARNGELIVEIEAAEDDLELASVDELHQVKRSDTPAIYTTRVGVLGHPVYPGTREYKAPPRPKKTKVIIHAGER